MLWIWHLLSSILILPGLLSSYGMPSQMASLPGMGITPWHTSSCESSKSVVSPLCVALFCLTPFSWIYNLKFSKLYVLCNTVLCLCMCLYGH